MSRRQLEKSILQMCKETDALISHCTESLSNESDDELDSEIEPKLFTDIMAKVK